VKNYIENEACDIELVLSTANPDDIINYVEKKPEETGLYFCDIHLQHEMTGIDLAAKIVSIDNNAKIVFITTHSELAYLTFRLKIETMDYIVKDDPEDVEKRVSECLAESYKLCMSSESQVDEYYIIKTNKEVWNIPFDDILFFETHQTIRHKMIIHTKNSQIEFRAMISDVAKISPLFFRCNKSFVVNTKNIKYVDKSNCKLEMVNGQYVPMTVRRIKDLLKHMT